MDDLMHAVADVRSAASGIPLELSPLLSPYGPRDRLTLRVERLPHRARLSRGRNNGDGTWSLAPDELEGLVYLPPEGRDEPHTLAFRIISLDFDEYGGTLAVLDLPVSPGDGTAATPMGIAAVPVAAPPPGDDAELLRLRDELAALDAALRERESALAEMDQRVARAQAEGAAQAEASLRAARTAWEAELHGHLADAAAEAAAQLAKSRAAWQAEQEERLGQAEARAQDRIEAAHERWRQEAAAALSQAEAAWRAEEAARLAAAEAQGREQSARALAEATARFERAEAASAAAAAQAEAARNVGDGGELRHLRDELVATQAALLERETKLAEIDRRVAHAQVEGARQTGAALSAARTAWEAELRERLAEAAAETAARFEQSRMAWHERWQREAAAALSKAEAAWRADEAARLAAAEAQWREQSARALAEATARFERAEARVAAAVAQAEAARDAGEAARDASDDVELRRLRDEVAAMETARRERETELAEMGRRVAQAQADGARQVETALAAARTAWETELRERLAEAAAALAQAETAWRADEAARLAAAEAQWRQQSAAALAEATARFERAEAALAAAAAEAEAARNGGDDAELRRLRDELAAVQAALRERETEAAAQSAAQQDRDAWTREFQAALQKAEAAWKLEEAKRLAAARVEWQKEQKETRVAKTRGTAVKAIDRQRRAQLARRLIGAGALAASLAAAVVYYPSLEPAISERLWSNIDALTDEIAIRLGMASAPGASQASAPAPEPTQAASSRVVALIDVPLANVRAGPSTASSVIATLPRDREVTPVERRGSWVRIRTSGDHGKPIEEGWVYAPSLRNNAGQ